MKVIQGHPKGEKAAGDITICLVYYSFIYLFLSRDRRVDIMTVLIWDEGAPPELLSLFPNMVHIWLQTLV